MSSRYGRKITDGVLTCEKIFAIEPYISSVPSGLFTLVVIVEEPCNAILGSDGNKRTSFSDPLPTRLEPDIPNKFISQRPIDGCIFESSNAVSRAPKQTKRYRLV